MLSEQFVLLASQCLISHIQPWTQTKMAVCAIWIEKMIVGGYMYIDFTWNISRPATQLTANFVFRWGSPQSQYLSLNTFGTSDGIGSVCMPAAGMSFLLCSRRQPFCTVKQVVTMYTVFLMTFNWFDSQNVFNESVCIAGSLGPHQSHPALGR